MKRRYGIFFGAVLAVLIMISTSTAVATSCVDKNVIVGKNKLSTLEKSLQFIDNEDVKKLVNAIIDEIDTSDGDGDGLATNRDIEQIEEKLGLAFPIHMGRIRSYGTGEAFSFPGLILQGCFLPYWGPVVASYWSGAVGDSETYINFVKRDGCCAGYILCYFGACSTWLHGPITLWDLHYSIRGTGLIIVTS